MSRIIEITESSWEVGIFQLNVYLNSLTSEKDITLDLSGSALTTTTDYYNIEIPPWVTKFKIIGKNDVNNVNNIYAALTLASGRTEYLECTIENLGLSAENHDININSVFIDVASDIPKEDDDKMGNILIYEGNNSIYSFDAAIHVVGGKRCIIKSRDINSKLYITSQEKSSAGIGGKQGENGGNIIIDVDGFLEVTGAAGAAGIGGGYSGIGGIIEVRGSGVIKAKGGQNGAGIGGGVNRSGGNIKILTSGRLEALGGIDAAGIGGAIGSGGIIEIISSGVINAYGGVFASGIGGGLVHGSEKIGIYGTAEIIAVGGDYGAGIGGGHGSYGGIVEIIGSDMITATGGKNAAGIGGGQFGYVDEIRLIGSGSITAIGDNGAEDIGHGYNNNNDNNRLIVHQSIKCTNQKPSVKVIKILLSTDSLKPYANNSFSLSVRNSSLSEDEEYTELITNNEGEFYFYGDGDKIYQIQLNLLNTLKKEFTFAELQDYNEFIFNNTPPARGINIFK